mmetsp:Transcript_2950/g.6848  ORF Transcript_2950/g.6848 Transcript_2950/m.6848 type:complete len:259 (-) Transcript_2950:22-798(-)
MISSSPPWPIRSVFVSTPIVRSPVGSTPSARSSMSTVAMSWFAGMTARMTVLSSARHDLMSLFTCSMACTSWPTVTVRMMPGRSTTVRSQASGETRLITTLSVEKLTSSAQSVCMALFISWLRCTTSLAFCTLSGVTVVDTSADQVSPSRALRITIRSGHLVTRPAPRGKGMPDSASRTLDFPEDWSPITQIWGILRSMSSCSRRRSSANFSQGRTSFSISGFIAKRVAEYLRIWMPGCRGTGVRLLERSGGVLPARG